MKNDNKVLETLRERFDKQVEQAFGSPDNALIWLKNMLKEQSAGNAGTLQWAEQVYSSFRSMVTHSWAREPPRVFMHPYELKLFVNKLGCSLDYLTGVSEYPQPKDGIAMFNKDDQTDEIIRRFDERIAAAFKTERLAVLWLCDELEKIHGEKQVSLRYAESVFYDFKYAIGATKSKITTSADTFTLLNVDLRRLLLGKMCCSMDYLLLLTDSLPPQLSCDTSESSS